MKLLVTSIFVLLSACGISSVAHNSSKLTSAPEDEIVSAVKGCYAVDAVEIDQSSIPNHPIVSKVLKTIKLCLEDTLVDGYVSRSGRIVVTAKNSNAEVVGGPWGFNVSDWQPRCLGCYKFSGLDGTMDWNGERRFSDANAPVEVSMTLSSLQTTFKFSLGQKAP